MLWLSYAKKSCVYIWAFCIKCIWGSVLWSFVRFDANYYDALTVYAGQGQNRYGQNPRLDKYTVRKLAEFAMFTNSSNNLRGSGI